MKKIFKIFGIVAISFAVVFAVSVATTSTTTSAARAKKLKFKKKKVTIKVGAKKKLGLTVKPKKAKVKWSTNKKKIASVSQKGVVKGKKTGTAVITAKSGKKKATCKVIVKAKAKKAATVKAGIKNVEVLDSKRVRVTLNKAYVLSKANFSLKSKTQKSGTYNRTLAVESISNAANTVYEVVLATNTESFDDENCIYSKDYVQVTISKLPGTKSKEVAYLSKASIGNEYISGKVGSAISNFVHYDNWGVGKLTYSISKLPAGIVAEKYSSYILFSGTPTSVCNGSKVTITAKDEMGNKCTRNVYFYIGSDTQIVTYMPSEYSIVLANNLEMEYFPINVVGGSGNYSYELVSNDNTNITVEDNTICISDSILPGTYSVSYKVTDLGTNVSVTGKKVLTVQKAVEVTGYVKTADGIVIDAPEAYFTMSDEKSLYYISEYRIYGYSEDGQYQAFVAPNQTYSVAAYAGNGAKYYRGQKVAAKATIININIPVYAVSLVTDDASVVPYTEWYDDTKSYNNNLGYGTTLYLKKGTYTINQSIDIKRYSAKFTVTGKQIVTLNVSSNVKGVLTLNDTVLSVVKNYEYTYYEINPTVTGLYDFCFSGITNWMSARLYEESDLEEELAGNSTYEEEMELSSVSLTAGNTYYLRLYADEGDAAYSLTYSMHTEPEDDIESE